MDTSEVLRVTISVTIKRPRVVRRDEKLVDQGKSRMKRK